MLEKVNNLICNLEISKQSEENKKETNSYFSS